MDEEQQDTFDAELRQMFDLCDTSHKGYLGEDELCELCHKLNVDEHVNALLQHLMRKAQDGRIDYLQFKEGVISFFTQIGGQREGDSFEGQTCADGQMSPKLVFGSKKYGRRSCPTSVSDLDEESVVELETTEGCLVDPFDEQEVTVTKAGSLSNVSESDSAELKEVDMNQEKTLSSLEQALLDSGMVDNGSGSTDCHSASPMRSAEQYLKGIWKKLDVGHDGYLNEAELARVCEHVGMEMPEEAVHQLFENLDYDQDGKISFNEFLQGILQHGNVSTDSSQGSSPVHRGQIFKSESQADREMSTSETGFFRSIDPDNTGFTNVSTLVEFWESIGLSGGMQTLKDLGFNTKMKINLHELSNLFEEELNNAKRNPIYQFAIATLQSEYKNLGSSYEQLRTERDKLRLGIAEANSRAALLAQEIDDHHAKLEKSSQEKLLSLEKKYQEQLRDVQDELRQEREVLASQTVRLNQQLQKEVENVKEEDDKLRSQLATLWQENNRLEQEIQEVTEKYAELQKLCEAQQKELESMVDLRKRLADLESGRDLLHEQHCQTLLSELDSTRKQNKELQDHNDELTLEVESIRQQLAQSRPRGKRHRRSNSWLSDYVKGKGGAGLKRRGSGSSTDDNSDDDSPVAGKIRRKICLTNLSDDYGPPSIHLETQQEDDESLLLSDIYNKKHDSLECYESDVSPTIKISVIDQSSHRFGQTDVGEAEAADTSLDSHALSDVLVARMEEELQQEKISAAELYAQLKQQISHLTAQLNHEISTKNKLASEKEQAVQQLKEEFERKLQMREERLEEQVAANQELQEKHKKYAEEMEARFKEQQETLRKELTLEWEKRFEEVKANMDLEVQRRVRDELKKELQSKSAINGLDSQGLEASELQKRLCQLLLSFIKTAAQQNTTSKTVEPSLQEEIEGVVQQIIKAVHLQFDADCQNGRTKTHETRTKYQDKEDMEKMDSEEMSPRRISISSASSENGSPTPTDLLLKDLYVENARLVRELQKSEERQRRAEQSNARLQYKCKILSKLLGDVTRAAAV